MSFLMGYGEACREQYGSLYLWLPIVAPIIGGLVGGALVTLLGGRFPPTGEQLVPVAEPAGQS